MMASLFEKNIWDDEDRRFYFNKLDILRKKYGLKKAELSKRIGVSNAYRKDCKRVSAGTLNSICLIFNVSPEWFSLHDVKRTSRVDYEHTSKPTPLDEVLIPYPPKKQKAMRAIISLVEDPDYALMLATALSYIKKYDKKYFNEICQMIFGKFELLKYSNSKKNRSEDYYW